MRLPTRTRQKKSETASLAIVRYKLEGLGIFRDQTENDYGIDLDLELVDDRNVTGRVVRIQVKSAEKLKIRKDGKPTIGGIKQSTLMYWCEISFRTCVVAYAVDLESEDIHITEDLFWQASANIDGGTSTKSISFVPCEGDVNLTKALTILQAHQPTMGDLVRVHTTALRRLEQFIGLLADAFHYDEGSDLHEPDDFRELLQTCEVLLWDIGPRLWSDPGDRSYWTSHDYWEIKSDEQGWGGLVYVTARPILATLLPALVQRLRSLRSKVIAGKYFWSHRAPDYLGLVHGTSIPDADGKDDLVGWLHDRDRRSKIASWESTEFVRRAKEPVRAPSRANGKPRT